MGALSDRIIAKAERQTGCEMPYLHTLADTSGAAFARWMLAMPATTYRDKASLDAWHLARLGATVAQDCGTCVQVVVSIARKGGLAASTLQLALDDPGQLHDDAQAAFAFGHAVASQAPDVADHVARMEALFGHDVHVELAMAVATCLLFPVIKRGLGQSLSCSMVTVHMD